MERRKREIERFRKQRERQSLPQTSSLQLESFEITKPLLLPSGYRIPKKQEPNTVENNQKIPATLSVDTNIVGGYMRNYMQKRRQQTTYKAREAAKDRLRKQVLRQDPDYKKQENKLELQRKSRNRSHDVFKKKERERETMQRNTKRADRAYKEKEKERETMQRRRKRTDPEYKEKEKERDTTQRKGRRLDPKYREKEKERETTQRKGRRLDTEYKEKEKERETTQRKGRRLDTEYKEKEKERETTQRKGRRLDPKYKEKEKECETSQRKGRRLDPEYKVKEKERETTQRKRKRIDTEYNEKEKERESIQRKYKRTDPIEKIVENERETLHRKLRRSNPVYKDTETVRETLQRRCKRTDTAYKNKECSRETATRANTRAEKSTDTNFLIPKFHQIVAEGPIYVCTSCKQLWYRHSVVKFHTAFASADSNPKVTSIIKDCPNYPSVNSEQWICKTCQTYIKKGKIPPLSTMNKMEFLDAGILHTLNPLEQTLLAVRLPFMKIHQAPRGKQHFLNGNMVLVPSNVSNTVEHLPRLITDTATIKAKLKRKLKYKHHVYSLNIRPELIRKAAHVPPLLAPFRGGGIEYVNDSDSYAGSCLKLLVGPPKPDR